MKIIKIAVLGVMFMTNSLKAAELTVHYSRLGGYEGWKLWVWDAGENKPGFDLQPSGTDAFGAVYKLELEPAGLAGKKLGLLPRRGEWEDKDAPDRFIEAAAAGELYLLEGDGTVYTAPPEISTKITGAWLDGEGVVRVAFNRAVNAAFLQRQGFYLTLERAEFQPVRAVPAGYADYARAAVLSFDNLGRPDYAAVNAAKYQLHSRDFKPVKLELGNALYGEDFYSARPMGAVTENGATVIRIFAPKAVKAAALIYTSTSARPEEHALEYKDHGVWEKNFGEPLEGRYYRLRVVQGEKVYEGLDPYARAVTADDGLALIAVDTTPVAESPVFGLSEAVIYEVHLRDLTMDEFSGVRKKGKYLGAAQEGTRHPGFPEIATGLDHMAELGVNTVHILPFQDFLNGDSTTTYDWGYMPVNFNSPEGSYATNTHDISRVREAKQMIDAFHRKGLKVVMDVVYNHTAETRSRVFNFNALAMDYYYRVNPDGSYSNGSGCGNEFNTEAPMARKFLVDSLLYWVREYKVDGFRFDLMGLIDLEAVGELVKKLREERPDIIIYGEPWAAGATPVNGVKKGSQRSRGYAVFSDNFRDALKGSVFNIEDLGYVQAAKNRGAVMKGIRGSVDDFTDGPLEVLNYVSCHDNNTLWDRIDLSVKEESFENKVRMDKLANAIVLTSQGVPFLHAGEEFLRTKGGEHNSYNLPDAVNRLDWTRKKKYEEVFNYYRDLLALRKAHPALRMQTAAAVRNNLRFYEELDLPLEEPAIAYILYGDSVADSWSRVAVLINPHKKELKFALPGGEWRQGFDAKGLYRGPDVAITGEFEVPPLSLAVLYRK
ncbi:MAG TPA: type I pullulanase [Elusimicrobiales bacterium]|nr:type I pullulanase [Elusimicrobiales bacterium]